MVSGHAKRTLDLHTQLARIYADTRFPPPSPGSGTDVRTFAVTVTWVIAGEQVQDGHRLTRVCELLHLDDDQLRMVIRADLPRYEPPRWQYQGGECEVPMMRRDGLCGRGTSTAFRVTDPDGTWRIAGYCSRHRAEARAAELAERARQEAGLLPEPLPNTGGLLPCYIRWNWAKNYALADPTWKPPQVGICADGWPALAKVAAAAAAGPPELRVHPGGGEQLAAGGGVPALRLVPPPQA